MVAVARAVASQQANPLVDDPFAAPLVRAAGIELFARLANGDLDFDDIGPSWMADFFGVRARFFDVAEPTAWLAEGLMIGYLPSEAQGSLLDTITALSALGSQLSADYLPSSSTSIGSMMLETARGWEEQGFDVDFGTLTFALDRSDVIGRLQAHGWQTTARGLADLLNDSGLSDHTMNTGPNGPGAIDYLTAARS
jgi:O-methyltransferase involved in polyketide biosynthesis